MDKFNKMDRLDEKISDHYLSKNLSPAKMQLLLARAHSERKKRWWPAYAAVVMILVTGVLIAHQHLLLDERKDIALRETAMNHITKLQVDFSATELEDLNSKMSKLDFALRLPNKVSAVANNLIGARYCTIAGNLAAHLRFNERASGKQLSLFMTPVADEMKHLLNEQAQIEGVNVKLWQEEGLFYAMADSTHPPR